MTLLPFGSHVMAIHVTYTSLTITTDQLPLTTDSVNESLVLLTVVSAALFDFNLSYWDDTNN